MNSYIQIQADKYRYRFVHISPYVLCICDRKYYAVCCIMCQSVFMCIYIYVSFSDIQHKTVCICVVCVCCLLSQMHPGTQESESAGSLILSPLLELALVRSVLRIIQWSPSS